VFNDRFHNCLKRDLVSVKRDLVSVKRDLEYTVPWCSMIASTIASGSLEGGKMTVPPDFRVASAPVFCGNTHPHINTHTHTHTHTH
jgi:hypothetical protein